MHKKKEVALGVIGILLIATTVFGGPTACPSHFANGEAPEFINQKLANKTRELCNEGYAIKHSGITRTPLYAAELITREGLQQGKGLPRSNGFRPDPRLPASERSELSDFARSGYGRVFHVYPAADATTAQSKDNSFVLSNMVPQDSESNRGIWNNIEGAVRKEAKRRGNLYVVSGPLYQGGELKALKGRVLIPTGMYKAVYDPARNEAAAYVVLNAPGDAYQVVSIVELEKIAGINLLPTLSTQIKSRAMQLPAPTGRGKKGGRR